TKSLKYGLRPFDVQRFTVVHLPDSCAIEMRRMPTAPLLELVFARASPTGASPGWTIAPPSHAYCHNTLPVAGARPTVPGPLMKITCSAPSIVARGGEV